MNRRNLFSVETKPERLRTYRDIDSVTARGLGINWGENWEWVTVNTLQHSGSLLVPLPHSVPEYTTSQTLFQVTSEGKKIRDPSLG